MAAFYSKIKYNDDNDWMYLYSRKSRIISAAMNKIKKNN